ncbi:MAG: MBL fold metallo-hydrolase [Flavobacteriaceae bacterium]|nr:MBL fold metallo-hydrolase [Flavobacteriaceae bacterium]
MTLHPIETGNFKLDGGAMFGVVPKSIWQKTNPSDSNNMIDISARCLLVEDKNKLVLIDTGMGDKQSEKFFSHYYRWGDNDLVKSINSAGFSTDEVTDVFLTHLHFDHCGGASFFNKKSKKNEVVFKNATYWSNKEHWNWAKVSNSREKASFLTENLEPIESSGQLKFLEKIGSGFNYYNEIGFELLFVDGHTEKQMIPKITWKGHDLVFTADLIPTIGHIPLPYIMGYDIRPLTTMKEKAVFLNEVVKNKYLLFFQHDAHNQIASLKETEKGVRLETVLDFNDI